jgi:hypothetical protein
LRGKIVSGAKAHKQRSFSKIDVQDIAIIFSSGKGFRRNTSCAQDFSFRHPAARMGAALPRVKAL